MSENELVFHEQDLIYIRQDYQPLYVCGNCCLAFILQSTDYLHFTNGMCVCDNGDIIQYMT